ncbi:MFS transporter [Nocardiopsis sp. CNT312]|uniref:MFS transporter n=1 Tax=Nocardiopsis sp. CNT312 TaxID=1137268 RepID=UPI00048E94D7|nr:MFS transporter [Nocardiopsis sp. CNT312]
MPNPSLDRTPEGRGHKRPNAPKPSWRSSYREVMGIGEFRTVWLAHALSMIGSNLLNITTSVLVYQATDSAFAAGATLAVTFLAPFVAGPLLSGLADVLPRRRVMVACDLARALVVVLIAVPGVPVWAVWALLFCSVLPSIPFAAARAALLTEIVQGERYVAGTAITQLTSQVGMLFGLVAGGLAVEHVDPRLAVAATSAVFALSAVILLLGVAQRPAPRAAEESRPGFLAMTRDGAALVFGDARLRTLALLAWLAGLYSIPYGLANPIADEAGAGPAAAGLIMAGSPVGALIGGFVLTRLVPPPTRIRLLGPLAVLTSVPLLLWLADPSLWLMVTALALVGMAGSYQFVANAAFVLCVPEKGRGLAFGLVAAGLQVVQGLGILVAGFCAEFTGTGTVVAAAGALGVCSALFLAVPWSREAGPTIERMDRTEQNA